MLAATPLAPDEVIALIPPNYGAATVEKIVLQELRKEPGMYHRLLVDRNKDWIPKIEALFSRKGRAFVVVGAAHLVGPDGLLALLKAKGYKIEQL